MKQGELALPSVAPGETGTMALPDVKINKQADVRLNVSIVLKEDALWAKAGHEILKEQFALNDHLMAVADGVQPGKRKSKFSVLDLWEDSYFQAFRAPTDNDKSFGNWLAKDWKNQGLDAPQVEVITPETETQETDGTVSKKSVVELSLIHISEPTRRTPISYAVFCLKKKKIKNIVPDEHIN